MWWKLLPQQRSWKSSVWRKQRSPRRVLPANEPFAAALNSVKKIKERGSGRRHSYRVVPSNARRVGFSVLIFHLQRVRVFSFPSHRHFSDVSLLLSCFGSFFCLWSGHGALIARTRKALKPLEHTHTYTPTPEGFVWHLTPTLPHPHHHHHHQTVMQVRFLPSGVKKSR